MILNILYHGLSCFEIEAKGNNNGGTVVSDPYDTKGTGLRLPRTLSADILTISRDSTLHNNAEAVVKTKLVITEPGEYEKSGIFVYGIPSKSEGDAKGEASIIYRYEFEDLVVVHLGDLVHGLSDEELSHLENVDILFLPIGGGESLDYKKAAEIANQIEPHIIIPMHYSMPGLTMKLDGVEKFLKEYGAKAETMPKLKIARKDLPQEETKVIILEKA
jgi:L-ascorbate metabolism protein UlaG (beta-lactamase superfamily)